MQEPVFTRVSPARPLGVKFFDRALKKLQRSSQAIDPHRCPLHKAVAQQLLERRAVVKKDSPVVLEVGAHTGWYLRQMLHTGELHGLKQYIQTDISQQRLNAIYKDVKAHLPAGVELVQICTDEDSVDQNRPFKLPKNSVDMVVSALSMHWVNDLEGVLLGIRKVLRNDGFAMISMFGANTLYELRGSLTMGQLETQGGVAPHTSPMIDGTGLSSLVEISGLVMPTIDIDRHVLLYKSPFHLMEHLQDMGENAASVIKIPLPREALAAAASIYRTMFGRDGLCPATFEIFNIIAWRPCKGQKQPAQRGASDINMSFLSSQKGKEFKKAIERLAANPSDAVLQREVNRLKEEMQSSEKAVIPPLHSADCEQQAPTFQRGADEKPEFTPSYALQGCAIPLRGAKKAMAEAMAPTDEQLKNVSTNPEEADEKLEGAPKLEFQDGKNKYYDAGHFGDPMRARVPPDQQV